MKKKILIPLNSDIFIRNYLSTNALIELKKKFSVIFCADEEAISIKKFFNKNNFAGYYNFSKHEKNYYNNFCLKYLLKNINKNNTINISLKVILNFNFFLNKYKFKFFFFPFAIFFYLKRFFKILLYLIIYRFLKKKFFIKKKLINQFLP